MLQRLFDLNKPFMVLMPLATLQSVARYKLFAENKIQLLIPDRRIDFWYDKKQTIAKGRSPFGSCYICRDILPQDILFKKIENYYILKSK